MDVDTRQQMLKQWYKWLVDNPSADSHQRYYAAGVIDGLRFAGEPFSPSWNVTLPETAGWEKFALLLKATVPEAS